ncbi:MAG: hypothetical protein LPK85_07095 [Gammaproteobacteria bacterium]|nr:hypothetical protein [Gammaproteobacteria bacterium]
MSVRARCSLLCLLCASLSAYADVFEINAMSAGVSEARRYQSVDSALAAITDAGLAGLLPAYTGREIAQVDLDFRGVDMVLAFPEEDRTRLTLQIPSMGVDESFEGFSRDDSQSALRDFVKKNARLLALLQRELVRSSPVDPVAGNPNSMMSRGVAEDFGAGVVSTAESGVTGGATGGLVGIAPAYTRLVAKSVNNPRNMDSGLFSLPLSYTRFFSKPGRLITVSMPLSQSSIEGAKAYDAGLTASFRNPVSSAWYLTATAGMRATKSTDMGSGVAMSNVALTSSYLIPTEGFGVTIGNMVGYYSTLKVKINDVAYNPDINNTVFRNGVLVEQPLSLMWNGDPLSIEYSLVDTRYTGTALFNRYQDELSVTIGTRRASNARASRVRGGFSVVEAPHARGFTLSMGYWF